MANIRIKNGKKPPIENKKGIVIAIPIIIIDPNEEVEIPTPKRPRVYKPPVEDTDKIYGRMADSELFYGRNNDDSDTDSDFGIKR